MTPPPAAGKQTLISGGRVLTRDPGQRQLVDADVFIEGDTIIAVGKELDAQAPPTAERIDAHGMLVIPGLINAHFHSPANFMKGALDSLPLELFMLYEVPALDAPVSARTAYIRTLLGAIEMLKAGVTAVQDDAFFIPVPTPDEIDGVMAAYRDCGIRANVALDQQDLPDADKLPFLEDLVPGPLRERLRRPAPMAAAAVLEHYDHLIHTWHGAADGRLGAAVSCSAPQRVSAPYLEALVELSDRHDLPFYIHMLETRLQRVFGDVRRGGRSLIRCVDERGLLNQRMNVIHAIWIDDRDIERLARSGAVVVHNPVSNLRLGSGVMPFRCLREAGVPIAIGTDEAIADDTVSVWAAMKLAGLIHNISDPDYTRWPKAAEVLDCVFSGGARAMRRSDRVGQIAPGYQADLIMLDLDDLSFTPLNDVARQLVYCDPRNAVRLTMVAGQVVARDGRVLTVDEAAVRAEARALVLQEVPRRARMQEIADEWMPHYEAMYRRGLAHNVGMNRWVGSGS